MGDTALAERITLLRARGGKLAAVYWSLRALGGVDVHRFYATSLLPGQGDNEQPLPDGCALLHFNSREAIAARDQGLIGKIDKQSRGASQVVANGGRLYAIVRGTSLICQLEIEFEQSYVDNPLDMMVQLGPKDAFLSFLYTQPSVRQGGWARKLISMVCADLAREGWANCIAQVQATNVGSVNTFLRCGWQPVAMLYATTGRRLLGVTHTAAARAMGVQVRVGPGRRK